MPLVPFASSNVAVGLSPAPIVPEWIESGNPVARAAELSRSHDGTAYTVVWECSAGSFTWTYDLDETIVILEGAIVLTDGGNPARRLGPGDVVFFPKGSRVHWVVEGHVRKLAFLRKSIPNPLSGPYRLLRRLKGMLRSTKSTSNMGIALGALGPL